ncbi:hypothetical protein A2U01_0028894, partial [Trifolium medium]|nr:hypothetical protein [Trifolium medium]
MISHQPTFTLLITQDLEKPLTLSLSTFQATATPTKVRSTRSKAKVEASAIIADAVPISTAPTSDAKAKTKSKSVVKKERSTKVRESSPSVSIKPTKKCYMNGVESNVDTSVKDSKISDVEASATVAADTTIPDSDKPTVTETLIPENPKSVEDLGQTELNVADTTTSTVEKADVISPDAVMSPTNNIIGSVLNSLKETGPEKNV